LSSIEGRERALTTEDTPNGEEEKAMIPVQLLRNFAKALEEAYHLWVLSSASGSVVSRSGATMIFVKKQDEEQYDENAWVGVSQQKRNLR